MDEIEEAVATVLKVHDNFKNSEFAEFVEDPEKGFIAALDGLGYVIVPKDVLEHECWDRDNFSGRPFIHMKRNKEYGNV